MTQCFSNGSIVSDSDPILVVRGSSASIRRTEQLLNAFQLFGTARCVEAAAPFLCVYLFGGVCDETGTHYLPTASECVEISTGVCQMEWEMARSIGMEIVDCSTLPSNTPLQCFSSTTDDDLEAADDENDENGS